MKSAFLIPALLVLLACGGARRYDTVLISVDTLRKDYVGHYNPKRADLTPNIDRLLADSVTCENAYTVVPQTFPSFASVFTGVYPWRHGAVNNQGFCIRKDVPVLTEQFQAAGYATAAVIGAVPLRFGKGLEKGFGLYEDNFLYRPATGNPLFTAATEDAVKFYQSQRLAMDITRSAGDALDAMLPAKRPLFLFTHYYDPHAPFAPPGEYAKRYAQEPYAGEVAYTDEAIGVLLRHLKDNGLYEEALIVFFSDHGEGLGEHGEPYHGYFLYNPTVAVPLAFKPPKSLAAKFKARRIEAQTSLMDVLPTVADLQGIALPRGLDGRSLRADMLGRPAPVDPALILSTEMPYFYFGWEKLYGVLRYPLKSVISSEPEVYDLKADPGETVNLYPKGYNDLYRVFKGHAVASRPAESPSTPDDAAALKSLGYLSSAPQSSKRDSIPPSRWPDKLAMFTRAEQAQFRGDLPGAIAVYGDFLDKHPDDFQCLISRADLFLRTGRTAEAVKDLLQARAIGDNYDIQTLLLQAYRRSGNKDQYHALLQEARAKSSDVLFLPFIVDDYLLRNDGDGALAFLRTAMAAFPKDGYAFLRAYDLLMDRGKAPEARTLVAAVVSERRTAPAVIHYFSGVGLMQENRREQAVAEFQESCRQGAAFHQPYLEAGLALKDKGDYKEAVRYLNAARLLASGNPRILFEWADSSAAAGNLQDALGGFARAAQIEPDNPRIRLALMKALWVTGDRKAALEQRRWLEAHAGPALQAARQADPLVAEILK